MSAVHVRLGGGSDVGKVRSKNEDSFAVVRLDDAVREPGRLAEHELGERGTLLVVCDGMGGAAAGALASQLAVDAFAVSLLASSGRVRPADESGGDPRTLRGRALRSAVRDANLRVVRRARSDASCRGMGTTLTALHLWRGSALLAQVGDSRAYVLRQRRLTQVTRDQSLINEMLEIGEITADEVKSSRYRNIISQALGQQNDLDVQLSKVELRRGDRLLVCSDGLTGVVSDEEIAAVLGATAVPAEAATTLIELANRAGGNDNITALVVSVDGPGLPEAQLDDVVRYSHWQLEPPRLRTKRPAPPPSAWQRLPAPPPLRETGNGVTSLTFRSSVLLLVLVLAIVSSIVATRSARQRPRPTPPPEVATNPR